MHSGIGDSSSDLGRNFMYHAGAIVVCIFVHPTGGSERFIKQLGWTNDYFGTSDFPHKLGYVQMLPIPGPLSLKKESPIPLPLPLARFLYKRGVIFTGCVEDLPQAENRIELKANGRIWLHHRFHEYDIFRSKYYLRRLKNLLRKCGASVVIGATSERDDIHTAHQVGTCRFGNDSKTSVLNPMCRLHEIDNVFVVDGSFMPTSLGVGPALTIIANALRVSDYIIKEGL
jgi:choline dehydrogenase-like flavoprotein